MRNSAYQVSTGLFLILALAFVLASVLAIFRFAVFIPYWDQWYWLLRYLSRNETFYSLSFTPINGHILAIPGLVFRVDVALFDASNIANLTVSMLCVAAICLLLRARFPGLADAFVGRTASIYLAMIAVLMVWFHNWENLFWPFQVHPYLSILLSMGSLLALSSALVSNGRRAVAGRIAATLVMGMMASASSGAGLGVWGAGLAIVVLGRWTAAWKWLAAVVALGVIVPLGLYLKQYANPGSRPVDVQAVLNFLALFLGSPAFPGGNGRVLETDPNRLTLAIGAGYLGMALAAFVATQVVRIRRRRALNEAELFFFGVMAFALLDAVIVAGARATSDLPSPALSSRYGVLCLLFWASAVPLRAASLASKASLRRVETLVPIFLLVLIAGSQNAYLEWWLKLRYLVEVAGASLASAVPDRDYLGYIYYAGDLPVVERVNDTLWQKKLSPLSAERSRYFGHSVTDFGAVTGACRAQLLETKRLAAGYRISGSVTGDSSPFDEQRAFVTDRDGGIIGVGAVEKRWPGYGRGQVANERRSWTAYAAVNESAIDSVQVYLSLGDGLCVAARQDGVRGTPKGE